MTYNLEFFLTLATLISGVMLLLSYWLKSRDWVFSVVDTLGSFFIVLLAVLIIRSFIVEPFRIPSGSMLPTLEIGDFILVNKFSYGLRLPVVRSKFFEVGAPERGDVVVFKYPKNTQQDFIKRVVGLPGDKIQYLEKTVYVNGVEMEQEVVEEREDGAYRQQVIAEQLFDHEHQALIYQDAYSSDGNWVVPKGHYFVMGDNRDNSNDSRRWGFVPEAHLLGRAFFIWLHWDWEKSVIDTARIGLHIE